ncbi:sensor histidine kinase [Mucilaginibacter jinjuensis]|uniref:histidine kinase n=1 Tax=Mucilaginibacter jinjuensis TaxID=1176721 RepID=A0ABY7T9Y6_9SPHI|nr:HAMP domain-containing sensor histidine kinase [Mucilaginibacter jinjuensis]WCT13113.1 HAMP domain-containing sensor histidine kinase [Mucilaginibacter jinjuensis]
MKKYWLIFVLFLWQSVFVIQLNAKNKSKSGNYVSPQKTIDSINKAARLSYLANPGKARDMAQNALLLSKQYNYQDGIAQSFLNMGITYWAQSYYPISLFYLNAALRTFDKNNHEWRSDCYRSIGRDYVDLKKYQQGLTYINLALKEAGSMMKERERALNERSFAYLRLEQPDKALADIHTAIAISRTLHNVGEIAILYGRMYSVYIDKKEFDTARLYCDTAYQLSIKSNNKRLRSTVWVGRTAIAYNQKKYPEAIKNAKIAAALADSLGVMDVYSFATRWLYRTYGAMGDKDNALLYQQKYIQLQDSLNRVDKQNSVQLIQDYFSLNNKLHDMELMENNRVLIKSQRETIINLGITVLVLVVALYILYRFYQQKKQFSKQLQVQNMEVVAKNDVIENQSRNLDELNQLKDRLLAVIGHDLKSPLANVRNTMDLFEQGYFTSEEVQVLMKDMSPAIEGAELTLSNLVEWAGSQLQGNQKTTTIVDLQAIAEETGQIFKHPLAQKNISLNIEIQEGQAVLADANHVKTILRNLINNAIKFTEPDGKITLSAEKRGSRLMINVKDNGRGMTAEEASKLFSTQTHFTKPGTKGEKGTGIGLLLCRQLAELNGGDIGVRSEPGEGSTFYFTLPVAEVGSKALDV